MGFRQRWKRGLVFALVGWFQLAVLGITQADVLWIVGQHEPIFGIVESSNDQQVMFRQTTDGLEFTLRAIKRIDIETMVVNHDSEKLASLQPGDWGEWLRLAEDLDSQKKDPVARDLAMRLLVVVAGNTDRDSQRRTAIEALVSFARSDSQREQLNRLRYLETGQGAVQNQHLGPTEDVGLIERVAIAELVRQVRLQQIQHAELARNEEAEKVVASLEGGCSWEELLRISRSNRIDESNGRRLVELELRLRRRESDPSPKTPRSSWHRLADQVGVREWELPTIENVTRFDPQATRFDDGKWVRR